MRAEVTSDVGDFNALVCVHRAVFSPGDGLNSGFSGQRAAAALEALASLHQLPVSAEPQRTLEKENTTTNQHYFVRTYSLTLDIKLEISSTLNLVTLFLPYPERTSCLVA